MAAKARLRKKRIGSIGFFVRLSGDECGQQQRAARAIDAITVVLVQPSACAHDAEHDAEQPPACQDHSR